MKLTKRDRERMRDAVVRENAVQRLPEKGEAGYVPAHQEKSGVRVCDTTCPYLAHEGPGCWHFRFGKAALGGPCVPDLNKIRDWERAYDKGETDVVRKDAGRLMGQLYVQAQRMVEQIDREGMTLRAPKTDQKGNPITAESEDGTLDYVWEVRPHPLIEPLTKVVKMLGIDLGEFRLTPKTKEQVGKLAGTLNVTKVDVAVVVKEEQEAVEQVAKILELSGRLRESDPVYKQFSPNEVQEGGEA